MLFRPVVLSALFCAAVASSCALSQQTAAGNPGHVAAPEFIVYRNVQYGFCFVLPKSWKGYSVVPDKWSGTILSSGQTVDGPQILIRNPKWTAAKPYQDIPIMVFTPGEWQQVQAVTMAVSAAPIGPSRLGQNSRYVFALPPRWIGFTDDLGQDELNAWMQKIRLQAPCGSKPAAIVTNP
ncbi:MAG TPA: hypothetical protein VMT38_04755 [Terracidiphilus sp.]|nr:hypothetical protein [Terracidiphilus sp.]